MSSTEGREGFFPCQEELSEIMADFQRVKQRCSKLLDILNEFSGDELPPEPQKLSRDSKESQNSTLKALINLISKSVDSYSSSECSITCVSCQKKKNEGENRMTLEDDLKHEVDSGEYNDNLAGELDNVPEHKKEEEMEIKQEILEELEEENENPWWAQQPIPDPDPEEETKPKRRKELKEECPFCGIYSFKITKHIIKVHSFKEQCSKCGVDRVPGRRHRCSTRKKVAEKKPRKPDKRELCPLCGRHVIKHQLEKHILSHQNVKEKCSTCDQVKQEDHKCFAPTKKKKARCMCTCGKTFIYLEGLQGHISSSVSEEEEGNHRFQCLQCDYISDDYEDFSRHEQIHKGSFKCEICLKHFEKKANMLRHLRKTHNNDQRPHLQKCDLCSKTFKLSTSLSKHVKSAHFFTLVPCPHCNKTYKKGTNLTNHIRKVHENREDFVCEICKRAFNNSASLKYHLTIHTGERPHPCPFCSRSFKIAKDLRRHFAIQHKELTVKCPKCKNHFLNKEDLKKHFNRYHSIDNLDGLEAEIEDDE